jgi:hypothetical protein
VPVQLERVHVRALPFYNGQVTSLTSIAEHEWTAPDPGAACPAELAIEIPGFVVPAADPQSRRLVILILIVQATLPQEGEATLTPSVETAAGVQPSPALPPLRLRALRPTWVPLVSRSDTPKPARHEQVLRLNTPRCGPAWPSFRPMAARASGRGRWPRSGWHGSRPRPGRWPWFTPRST